jgi:ATP-dependent protease HslVU (ClpYQ) peptidase subunit
MTVVAYKDGVLACDSASTAENIVVDLQTKIRRLNGGCLYGVSGDCDDRKLVELLHGVTRAEDIPSQEILQELHSELNVILVLPSGEVWIVCAGEKDGGAYPITADAVAVGSGDVVALAAMKAGASAERACEIACEMHAHCRAPVHTLKLKQTPDLRLASSI